MNKKLVLLEGFILALLLTQLLAGVSAEHEHERSFVRIDLEKVRALKPLSLTVAVAFANLTYVAPIELEANQSLESSATFPTSIREGPFSVTLKNKATNASIFEVVGELSSIGARIVQSWYEESLLEIMPEDNSVTISVGAVSANFTFIASLSKKAKYTIDFGVENVSRSLSVEGDEIVAIVPMSNMPPTVSFEAMVKVSNNSTVLASISGTLDFVRGVGIDIKSNYSEPVTFINLTVERTRSLAISRIPNTQIVKIPAQPIPLTQPTDPIIFAFGTPKPASEEGQEQQPSKPEEQQPSKPEENGTQTKPSSPSTKPLIDLKPIYDIFSSNLAKIVVAVLVLFAAVVIAKRLI